jgi:hypothetical protein
MTVHVTEVEKLAAVSERPPIHQTLDKSLAARYVWPDVVTDSAIKPTHMQASRYHFAR